MASMNTTSTRQALACKRCGSTAVHWATRKNGTYYLAVVLPASPDFPHSTAIKRPHVCPSDEQLARRAEQDAAIERSILLDMLHSSTDPEYRSKVEEEMDRRGIAR